MTIPFNKPFLSGKETSYIVEAINRGNLSGNGLFTKKCHQLFKKRYGFQSVFLTTSCTDALEMTALLMNLQADDEVIVPSFTFVSTANAYKLRNANVVFADSSSSHPNVNAAAIERCITPKTKACVVVHYAGCACDMDPIIALAKKHNLLLVEDAAHAIDGTYKGKPLGTLGDFATFSFHETKNIICGEGGMLVVNNLQFRQRAEIIWEKGTNRAAFFRNEIDKYEWIDLGSSFLPSELCSAFLFAQLETIDKIQAQRLRVWRYYYSRLSALSEKHGIDLPTIPKYASENGHLFYLICTDNEQRNSLIQFLKNREITAIFHYLPLHLSPYYTSQHKIVSLPNAERFAECIVRLPLYYEITDAEMEFVADSVEEFFANA